MTAHFCSKWTIQVATEICIQQCPLLTCVDMNTGIYNITDLLIV